MRPILLLAAFLSITLIAPPALAGDSLFEATKNCDIYDYDCNHPRDKKLFNDESDEKDRSKSEKPQDATEPRDMFDRPKKSNSIGDSIREQLKPR